MKTARNLVLIFALSFASLGNTEQSTLGQLPVPWPFPWAKECPVNWESLGGFYTLTNDSFNHGSVSLRISVLTKNGLRLLRVSRYTTRGTWKYEGTTFVTENQKLVHLNLSPVSGKGEPIWATLKLHYLSEIMECAADRLVPIMTVQASDKIEESVDYKLERVGN